jgi:glycosyltransferase involved in cell wall biosynthesis
MDLLQDFLVEAGHEVHRIDWAARSMDRCDVGVFLELLNPRLLPYMRKSVGIFNMEWFAIQWRRYLNNMDQLWAKSNESHEIFNEIGLGKKARYTGFMSRDLYDAGIERADTCLHFKGHSDLKNTPAVLEAWRRHPDLPQLTIVSNNPVDGLPDNVRLLRHVSHGELVRLMNESRIHLCPSRSEGWGHYITEGLSAGAYVIATNASPMNEHVRSEWGRLVEPSAKHRRGMASEYDVDPDAIANAVRDAMLMDAAEREKRSMLARNHIASRNQEFEKMAIQLLGELQCT